MRCALYARVSTLDQEPENQLAELRRYSDARGWTSVEYVDHGVSGTTDRRPALDRLVTDARRHKVDVVVTWKLDRLGRSLKRLRQIGRAGHIERFRQPSSSTPNIDALALRKKWLVTAYHSPKDDASQAFDFGTSTKFAHFVFLLGHAIAMDPTRPTWNPNDFFGKAFSVRHP